MTDPAARRPLTAKAAVALLVALMAAVPVLLLVQAVADPVPVRFALALASPVISYVLYRCANGVAYGHRNAWQSSLVVALMVAATGAVNLPGPVAAATTGAASLLVLALIAPWTSRWCSRVAKSKGLGDRVRDAAAGR